MGGINDLSRMRRDNMNAQEPARRIGNHLHNALPVFDPRPCHRTQVHDRCLDLDALFLRLGLRESHRCDLRVCKDDPWSSGGIKGLVASKGIFGCNSSHPRGKIHKLRVRGDIAGGIDVGIRRLKLGVDPNESPVVPFDPRGFQVQCLCVGFPPGCHQNLVYIDRLQSILAEDAFAL